MSYKGNYKLVHPEKYEGDIHNIVYRSLWERDVMYHFDHNSNVLQWSNEEIVIPYISPLDMRVHRYFPDFFVKIRTTDGKIIQSIIEVKPKKQTIEPKKPKTPSRKFMNESTKYLVNTAKWEAAQKFCDKNNLEFKIMTEYDIYGPSGKKYSYGKNKRHTKKTRGKRKRE